MTLERILQAAVNSMITGHHAPHCYSAHVPGRGYVNDGSAAFERADYLRQLERTAQSEIENIRFASEYADQSYTSPAKGILLADWNNLPRGLERILERAGYAIEWSDEWSVCDSCQRAIRTSPDSYCYRPEYSVTDGEILCLDCVQEESESYRDDDSEQVSE